LGFSPGFVGVGTGKGDGGGPGLGPPCGHNSFGHSMQPSLPKHHPPQPKRPHGIPGQPQNRHGVGKRPKNLTQMLMGNGMSISLPLQLPPGPHGRPIQPQPIILLARIRLGKAGCTHHIQEVCTSFPRHPSCGELESPTRASTSQKTSSQEEARTQARLDRRKLCTNPHSGTRQDTNVLAVSRWAVSPCRRGLD